VALEEDIGDDRIPLRISHRHKFVFLSKPKCASEAVRAALDPFSDITSTHRYPWFHHTPLAPLKREFDERGWDWDSYFVFTTVRNPYSMLNSLYAYGKPDMSGLMWADRFWDDIVEGRDPPLDKRFPPDPLPFREWVLTHDLSRLTLDPFIRDETGQICTSEVIRVEALKKEFEDVAVRLGLVPAPTLVAVNVGGPYSPQPFDEPMRDRVREVFQTDFEIGGYPVDPLPARKSRGVVEARSWLRRGLHPARWRGAYVDTR